MLDLEDSCALLFYSSLLILLSCAVFDPIRQDAFQLSSSSLPGGVRGCDGYDHAHGGEHAKHGHVFHSSRDDADV